MSKIEIRAFELGLDIVTRRRRLKYDPNVVHLERKSRIIFHAKTNGKKSSRFCEIMIQGNSVNVINIISIFLRNLA